MLMVCSYKMGYYQILNYFFSELLPTAEFLSTAGFSATTEDLYTTEITTIEYHFQLYGYTSSKT